MPTRKKRLFTATVEWAGSGEHAGSVVMSIREASSMSCRSDALQRQLRRMPCFANEEACNIRVWAGHGGPELTKPRLFDGSSSASSQWVPEQATRTAWNRICSLQTHQPDQHTQPVVLAVAVCDCYQQAVALLYVDKRADLMNAQHKTVVLENKDLLIKALKYMPLWFTEASTSMQQDTDVVLAAVKASADLLAYVGEDLHTAEVVLAAAVSRAASKETKPKLLASLVFNTIPAGLKDDLAFVRRIVQAAPFLLFHLPQFCDTYEVVEAAVTSLGCALQFASQRLTKSKPLVKLAVASSGLAIQYASEELRADGSFLLELINSASTERDAYYVVRYADTELKQNEAFMAAAVDMHASCYTASGMHNMKYAERALQCLHVTRFDDWHRNQTDFMLLAVKKDPFSLMHASDCVKMNREVVETASQLNRRVLWHAHISLVNQLSLGVVRNALESEPCQARTVEFWQGLHLGTSDMDVVLQMVQLEGLSVMSVAQHCRTLQVVQAAVRQNGLALCCTVSSCRDNQNGLVLCCKVVDGVSVMNSMLKVHVSSVPSNYRVVMHCFEQSKELVMSAVAQNGKALMYAAPCFYSDREVVMAAVVQDGTALHCARGAFIKDRDVVIAAVAQNGLALRSAHAELRDDKHVVMAAVVQNGMALQYASVDLQDDDDCVLAAVRTSRPEQHNYLAFKFASRRLKRSQCFVAKVVACAGQEALEFAQCKLAQCKLAQ